MDKKNFKPISVDLKAEKIYYWCHCGKSDNQPFCDGSHDGTECEPLLFIVKEDSKKKLCTCKKTKNQPYCDGTHKTIK